MLSRIILACAAAVCGAMFLGGCVANPAPLVDASVDNTLPLPMELRRPGGQVKVRIPGSDVPVLVWRMEIGFGAATLRCTHCGGEIRYEAGPQRLICPIGARFSLDGSIVDPGPRRKPLRTYVADLIEEQRLRILG